MIKRQYIFRFLGILSIGGGFYALYDFGSALLPLFEQFVAGKNDPFTIFVVCTSFFLGSIALIWTGVRFVTLRSFGNIWVSIAMLPLTAWLYAIYTTYPVFQTETLYGQFLGYFLVYGILVALAHIVHVRWFMPVSHDDGRTVSLEKSETPLIVELRFALLLAAFLIFVIFNPHDALSAFNTVLGWIIVAWKWVTG